MSAFRALCISNFVVGLLVAALATAQPGLEKIQPELLEAIETLSAEVVGTGAGDEPMQHRIRVVLKRPEAMTLASLDYASAEGMTRIQSGVESMQEKVLSNRIDGAYRAIYRYKSVFGFSAVADREAIAAIALLPDVERVEIMPLYYKMSDESHPLAAIDTLHDIGVTGEGVTIAIIDDGIDHDHAAFGGLSAFPNVKIIGGRDFADNDDDPTIDCTAQSHGTAVAGVAAGQGGGVTGTAPDARIVMLKVQSAMLCGEPALDGDLVGAVDWAVTHRDEFDIRVLSMSLGGGGFSTVAACEASNTALRDAIDAAAAAGLVVLAASGNDGRCGEISRPACIGNAISVGAVYDGDVGAPGFCVASTACNSSPHPTCAQTGRRACFDSSTDADQVTCYSNSAPFLDILAPSNCASTAAAGGGINDCFGGTSSATPFAAGLVAALIEVDDTQDNDSMRVLLTENGVNVQDAKSGLETPRVDAAASLATLDDGCPPAGLSSDFETGLGEWQATGLWHAAADGTCASTGFTGSAYYGQDAGCNYDTGSATSGALTSPEIFGVTASSVLTFDFLRQVESFSAGSFDRTWVEVVSSGGVTSVFSLDSNDPSANARISAAPISLAAFAGETIRVVFRFDSMDAIANGSTGWLIDDVGVTGTSMCGGL